MKVVIWLVVGIVVTIYVVSAISQGTWTPTPVIHVEPDKPDEYALTENESQDMQRAIIAAVQLHFNGSATVSRMFIERSDEGDEHHYRVDAIVRHPRARFRGDEMEARITVEFVGEIKLVTLDFVFINGMQIR